MAYTSAVDILPISIELSDSNYVNFKGKTYTEGFILSASTVEFNTGNYVSDYAKIFTSGFDISLSEIEFGIPYVKFQEKIYFSTEVIEISTLAPISGDDTQEIVFGLLSCDFTYSPSTGYVPLTVDFTQQCVGVIDTYAWDFGDGNTSTEENPTNVYTSAATYTIELVATNFVGKSVSHSETIQVFDAPGASAFCSDVGEDYITLSGPTDKFNARFGENVYLSLLDYIPRYLRTDEIKIFVKFFEDYFNTMYEGYNRYFISANDLVVDRYNNNDKYYIYKDAEGDSVSASTSADYADELTYDSEYTDAVRSNLEISYLEDESSDTRISILEKGRRLTELHDPDTADTEYIQFIASNLGYDVDVNREQIGSNLGELTNQSTAHVLAEDELNREKYLRFIVRNLPTWYKIKTTRNSIKSLLYSFGLISDVLEYYSSDYNKNWILDSDGSLNGIPDNYFPTSHYAVQINIDDSIGSISFDWERRQKVINAIESVRPVNSVFKKLTGYVEREVIISISANMRIRNNIVIR